MKEVTGDCGPLAQMIKDFLVEAGVPPERIYLNPKGHDTLSMTTYKPDRNSQRSV